MPDENAEPMDRWERYRIVNDHGYPRDASFNRVFLLNAQMALREADERYPADSPHRIEGCVQVVTWESING